MFDGRISKATYQKVCFRYHKYSSYSNNFCLESYSLYILLSKNYGSLRLAFHIEWCRAMAQAASRWPVTAERSASLKTFVAVECNIFFQSG
jgi:hypothetical protein